jgi:hypothetical protein
MHYTIGTMYGQGGGGDSKNRFILAIAGAMGPPGREGRPRMGTIVHTSRIAIVREKGPTRIARIEGFPEPVYYGVHGGIKNFYKVEPEKEHAATLDHIVGAVSA